MSALTRGLESVVKGVGNGFFKTLGSKIVGILPGFTGSFLRLLAL